MSIIAKTSLLDENLTESVAWEVVDDLILENPSKILLDLNPADVAGLVRDGNDLIVETLDGRVLKIVDFYVDAGDGPSELYLVGDEGDVLLAELSPAGADGLVAASYVPTGEMAGFEMLAAAPAEADGAGAGLILLGGAAAAGLVAAAAGGGGGGGSSSSDDPAQDTAAPEAPANVAVSDDGSSVTGEGEPGTTVTVTDADGNVIGEGTVGADGTFEVALDPAQTDGEELEVVLTDDAGNESEPTNVTAPDTTAPDAPTLNVEANEDGTLTASGEAEPGSTVTVTFPDGSTAEVVAGDDGTYEVTSETPQTSGEVSATATDEAGNESDPTTVAYEDTTAPLPPILEVAANEDGTLTASGEAEPGSTVTVTFPDGSTAEVVAGDDGTYEVTSETPQTSGDVTATATDEAGNESDPTTVAYEDTTAPAAPAIASATDDVGDVTGELASGDSTDDTTPTLSGTAEAGSTVEIFQGGASIGTATADADGNWSFAVPALAEGSYSFTATATDEAGNTSAASGAFALTVDTTAPEAPTIDELLANDDGTLTVNGTAEAGSTVTVTFPDGSTAEVVADADGNYSVTSADPQTSGDVTATATDEAGNESDPTTVAYEDTTAPLAPTIVSATDDVGDVTGELASGDSTDDTTPTLTGTAEAGSTVEIFQDGVSIGTATADADGNWSFAVPALVEGSYSFTATATDEAGNTSAASGAFELTVDTTSPGGADGTDAPVLAIAEADDGSVDADELADGIQTNVTLTDGTQEGDTITLTLDDGVNPPTTVAYTVTADDIAAGSADVTIPGPLADGDYSVTAVIADDAGNSSAPSNSVAFTVDATSPGGADGTDAPVLAIAEADDGFVDADELADGIQANVTLTAGTQEGDTITLTIDDGVNPPTTVEYTVTAADISAGSADVTIPGPLADGDYSVTAVVADDAGNTSATSDPVAFTVDATAPAAPTVVSATDDVGDVTGELASGDSTDDTTPTLTGTAEAGSTVEIFQDGVSIGTATADGDGNWSFAVPALAEGSYSFTATATDAAGNESEASGAFELTVDTTAPETPTINPTDGTLLAGTAEPGSTVEIDVDGDGVPDYTTTADAEGNWSVDMDPDLADGTVVTATATDAAGNTSPEATTTVDTSLDDTTPPAAPVIASATDDVGDVTGELASGDSTDDTTPTLTGTAEAGSTVEIFQDGVSIGTATADADGNWSFAVPALAEGSYSFTATATDAAGNESEASGAFELTVDTTAPEAPVIDATDGTVVSGTAEAGSTVELDVDGDGVPDYTTTADADGNWSVDVDPDLADGTVVTATATDAAGNTGPEATATVDATAPAAPTVVSATDDVGDVTGELASSDSTDDTTPTLTGTAEAGSTVEIFQDGVSIGTATADADGNWSFAVPALAEGSYSFTATATDEAGNTSVASAAFELTVDTTAPEAPVIDATDGTVVSGTAEAGSTVELDVDGDGVPDYTTTADADGNWSVDVDPDLADGTVVTATATDAAGNTGPEATATVDATAPAAPTIVSATDDVGDVTGELASGDSTDDTTPTLTGTAEAGSTVEIFQDGVSIGTATADADGNWSFAVPELAEGSYDFTATATDLANNESAISAAFTLIVDTTIDTDGDGETVRILGITDDDGVDNADFITSDTTLLINGTVDLDDGNTFSVDFNGTLYTEADAELTVNADGTWTLDLTATTLAEGAYTVTATVTDAAGNTASSSKEITVQANVAPDAIVNDGSLLGLVGAETLGLLDFNDQAFIAYDRDGNLQSVVLEYDPLLAVLTDGWNISERLAAELGLQVDIQTDFDLALLVDSSTLTITALDGGTIDNLAINELLGSVYLGDETDLISADLLSDVSMTATDSEGLSDTASAVDLLDATLLSADTVPVIEGTDGDDTVEGTADADRLYGYDGNDTLNGNGGNDLLRGGAGDDTLNGGAGDDLLIYEGLGSDTFNGGDGEDTLLLEGGDIVLDFVDTVSADYVAPTTVNDIEHLNIGGSGANEVTLDEAAVLELTDADNLLHVEGDQGDTLNLAGAWTEGATTEIGGVFYTQYTLNGATLQVEDGINVEVA